MKNKDIKLSPNNASTWHFACEKQRIKQPFIKICTNTITEITDEKIDFMLY